MCKELSHLLLNYSSILRKVDHYVTMDRNIGRLSAKTSLKFYSKDPMVIKVKFKMVRGIKTFPCLPATG